MNNVSKNLKSLRKVYKLSQTQLGEKINFSKSTISDWENGITEPNIETLVKLSRIFEVSLADIIE